MALDLGSPKLRMFFQDNAIRIIEAELGPFFSAYTVTGRIFDRLVLPLLKKATRKTPTKCLSKS